MYSGLTSSYFQKIVLLLKLLVAIGVIQLYIGGGKASAMQVKFTAQFDTASCGIG